MTQRIAVVTGGMGGLGLAICQALARAGRKVVATDLPASPERLDHFRAQTASLDIDTATVDVADFDACAAFVQDVEARHGALDILVNNAGIMVDDASKGVSGQSLDTWRTTFDTNLFGLIETTQAFLPLLRKSNAGRIVNVSSLLGSLSEHQNPASFIYEFKAVPAYNVSKSAVNAWTIHLAHELKDTGIKVNTIHPGYVQTDMNKSGDQQNGELSVPEGARTSVQLALIDNDGPTGGYYYFDQVLPW